MTATTRAIDTAIFDLGGVLMHNGRPKDIAGRFGGDNFEKALHAIMGPPGEDGDHAWHRLERGEITIEVARAEQRAALQAAGLDFPVPPAEASSSQGSRSSFAFNPNEAMLQLVRDLRVSGVRTAILTNNVREFRPLWWPLMPWADMFDEIVDSHEVGVRKPNPAIYRLTLERLGAQAGRSVFLDDLEANVAGAQAVGMFGVHVDDDSAPAIDEVRRLAAL